MEIRELAWLGGIVLVVATLIMCVALGGAALVARWLG